MADKILIKFEADITELDQAVDGLVLLGKVDKSVADQFKAANANFAVRKQALADDAAATDKASKSIGTMAKSLNDAAKESAKTNQAIKEGAAAIDKNTVALEQNEVQTKTVKRELRELTQLIAQAKASGGPIPQEAIKRAGELKDAMNDANQTIKNLASDTRRLDAVTDAIKGVAAGFAIAQGAAALFGTEDKELQRSLLKVQAAMAILNGVTEIQNILQKESALLVEGNSAKRFLYTGVTAGMTVSEIAATVATNVLNASLAVLTGPVIAVIGAIGLLVVAYKGFTSDSNAAAEATKNLKDEHERFAKSDEILLKQLKDRGDQTRKQLQFDVDLAKAQGKSKDEIAAKEKVLLEFDKAIQVQALSSLKTKEGIAKSEDAFADAANKQAVVSAQAVTDSEKEKAEARKKANEAAFKAAIDSEKIKLIALKEALITQLRQEEITKKIFDTQLQQAQDASLNKQLEIEKKFGKDFIGTQESIDNSRLSAIVKAQDERQKQAEKEKATKEKNAAEDLGETFKAIDIASSKEVSAANATGLEKLNIEAKYIATKQEQLANFDVTEEVRNAQEIDLTKQLSDKKIEIEKQTTEDRKKLREDLKNAGIAVEQEAFDVVSELNKREADEKIKASEDKAGAEIASLDRQLASKTITQEQYDKKRKAIEANARKEQAAIKREEFIKQKEADTIQAIIKTALAIITAMPNVPLAVAAGIVGAAQIALIATQPIPKFAKGVERLNGAGTGTSDSIHAMLSKGERVVPSDINEQYYPALSAIHNKTIDSKLMNGFALGDFSMADIQAAKASRAHAGMDEYGMRRAVNGAKVNIGNANEIGAAVANNLNDMSYFNERYAA